MKLFSIQITLLFSTKSYIFAQKLPRFGDHKIQDLKYNPELVGKYHTDAFNSLKEKYKDGNNIPSSLSDAVKDITQILNDYCPSNDSELFDSCVQNVSKSNHKKYSDTVRDKSVIKFLSSDKMKRAQDVISNMGSKQDTLDAISTLKQECNKNDIEERGVLAALSVAEESYTLWYDFLNDDNHPFHFPTKHGRRKLQACLDLALLVKADVLGAIEGYLNGGSFDAMIVDSITFSFQQFVSGCDDTPFETISPSISPTNVPSKPPTNSPTISPTNVPSKPPTNSPTVSPTNVPSKPPTNSPTNSPTINPTVSPTSDPTESPTDSPTFSLTMIPTNSPTKYD